MFSYLLLTTKIKYERGKSYLKNEQISAWMTNMNTLKFNCYVSTITYVFLNHKRVNAREHAVKMTPHVLLTSVSCVDLQPKPSVGRSPLLIKYHSLHLSKSACTQFHQLFLDLPQSLFPTGWLLKIIFDILSSFILFIWLITFNLLFL